MIDRQKAPLRYSDMILLSQASIQLPPLVSFVPQEPYIFPVSILDNIGYGRLNATREEVIAAATAAGVHRCVSEWPDGYDTVVSGEELSGGQRQRISIARALLKGTPVLQKKKRLLRKRAEAKIALARAVLSHARRTLYRHYSNASMNDSRSSY
ncbi:ATP-binding cassette domain-containing protein [Paenibacillus rhizoplanae]